ncbi:MAG TPA: SUMF1/EgtB/PvdO family nonheme iron enzyme [Anaerolineae bacterium]
MLQIDQLLQNRYRIARVLGQGGMGAVYQAQDLNLDVICVVKEMLPPPDPALVRNMALQFQREGKILASLRHMSLPRVSNYFTENENYYLVMDLIEGRSLEKLIGDTGLPESTVLQYADQLLDVLGYIHSKGILHRDIKPANIIVQPDGRVVLVDFGLVKVINTGGPVTKTLVSALTPQYAPPEQYTGNTDARSDLYSLAATLYQALAGHPPASATDQLSGLKLQPLRQLPHLQTSVSANTEYVLMKALNLDRAARYQDAASMRTELKDGVGRTWQPQPTNAPVATQVWSPDAPAPLPPATTSAGTGSQPVSTPVSQPAASPSRPQTAPPSSPISTPVRVSPPSTASAGAVLAPAKKTTRTLLFVGIAVVGIVVFCIVGLAVLSAIGDRIPSAKTDTPTAASRGEASTIEPAATDETTGSQKSTTAPSEQSTEVPTTGHTSSSSALEATTAARIEEAATAAAGTNATSDDRILSLQPGIELALARVPAGEFLMGSADNDKDAAREEKPQELIKLDDYWISVDDVTVEEFAAFVQATGYRTTAETVGTGLAFNSATSLVQIKGANWLQPGGPNAKVPIDLDFPVVQVSWDDANAFCAWASKVSGRKVKLPTEAQWEKAARGNDGRIYPWGNNQPDSTLLNWNNQVGHVEAVSTYSPGGDSPYGVSDMAGNVWQWTSSLPLPYPYIGNDGREDASSRDARVLRGGAFLSGFITSPKNSVRSAARGVADPTYRNGFVSFRVVVAP